MGVLLWRCTLVLMSTSMNHIPDPPPFAPIDQDEFAERFYGYMNAKLQVQQASR
jgi:hypothetical protein